MFILYKNYRHIIKIQTTCTVKQFCCIGKTTDFSKDRKETLKTVKELYAENRIPIFFFKEHTSLYVKTVLNVLVYY